MEKGKLRPAPRPRLGSDSKDRDGRHRTSEAYKRGLAEGAKTAKAAQAGVSKKIKSLEADLVQTQKDLSTPNSDFSGRQADGLVFEPFLNSYYLLPSNLSELGSE